MACESRARKKMRENLKTLVAMEEQNRILMLDGTMNGVGWVAQENRVPQEFHSSALLDAFFVWICS
jgi:hypothetical protein